jgi:DNA-binding transcriptional regulator YiaG
MAKSFKNLRDKMSPENQKRAEAQAVETLKEINLRELREAFELTQQQLAETLNINQAAISKMENQSDMYVSTLRRVLAAVGAKLRVVAVFSDGGEVVIDQFSRPEGSKRSRRSAG